MNIADLEKRFSRVKREYKTLQMSADANVKTEQWATGPIVDMEPFEIYRGGDEYGKLLSKVPTRTNNKYWYGYDSDGRIVVRRVGVEFPGQFYEEFVDYTGDRIESAYFGATKMKELINVKVRLFADGRVAKILTCGKYGNRREVFAYGDGLLEAIQVEEFPKAGAPQSHRVEFLYNTSGDLISIQNVFPNGRVVTVFPCSED